MLNTIHNVDPVTVTDFGREWHRFDQSIIIPPVLLLRSKGKSRTRFGDKDECSAHHQCRIYAVLWFAVAYYLGLARLS
jgi:hypothetical protein